ncbi:helix-turn-helix domain-containing protein [Rufibacter latericius]|uniref:XRE family transcriptional regulator n=1 Tax=Rufibacter latericius TaxID=2487040 RepID=A0A3M9MN37_9BACT|nr:XRE family transcriptional regulator [Rufibacter latericius]
MTSSEVKALRTHHGLTQKQLAEAIGVKVTKISEWENGRYQSISPVYQKLLKEYFTSLDKS